VLESDITEEQQAADAVELKVAGLGRPDTLINDAGVMLHGLAVGPATAGVAADGRAQRARTALLRARRAAPICSAPPGPARATSPTW
jgi:NADP-dependent 3-hydroxy acid dehydrogenase YdfG